MDGHKRHREKVLLIPWLYHHLDECTFGHQLRWCDKNDGKFVVRWKHKSSCEWKADTDLLAPVAWASMKGKLKNADESFYQRCKTNFRCALRSRGIKRIGRSSNENVYQFPVPQQQFHIVIKPIAHVQEEFQPVVDNDDVFTTECKIFDMATEEGFTNIINDEKCSKDFMSNITESSPTDEIMRNAPIMIDEAIPNDSGYADFEQLWTSCVSPNCYNVFLEEGL